MLRKSDSCKIRSEPDLLFRQGCRSGSIQVCVIALHQGLKPTHLLSFSGYCKKPRSCTNSIFFLHYAFPSSPADCKFKLKKVPDTIMVCGHLDSQLQLTPWRGDIFPLPWEHLGVWGPCRWWHGQPRGRSYPTPVESPSQVIASPQREDPDGRLGAQLQFIQNGKDPAHLQTHWGPEER